MNTEQEQLFLDMVKHIDTIPDERFNLNSVMKQCGTIGCAAGHILQHPRVRELAFSVELQTDDHFNWRSVVYHKEEVIDYDEAMSRLFGLTMLEVEDLFSPLSFYDKSKHKQVWKDRVAEFLESRA